MKIRSKLILFLIVVVLFSTLLMMSGAIWLTKRNFQEEMKHRFRVTTNLFQLSLFNRISELQAGLNSINNNKELTRDVLVALSANRPTRTNFFRYFFSLAEFAKLREITQSTVHFVSANNRNFQIYGAYEKDRVYSFSTKKDSQGRGLLELELDSYGFILPTDDPLQNKKFLLPISIDRQIQSSCFHSSHSHFYLDIHFPLVNQSMGVAKEKSSGFAYLGMKYGMIRAFVELTPDWLHQLEEETGVKLDIHLPGGGHGLGDLQETLDLKLLDNLQFFKRKINNTNHLGSATPIELNGKLQGYLVTSVSQSFLTNQIVETILTLLAFGFVSLILSISLASLSAVIFVRPIMALEKSAEQLAEGDLRVLIETSRQDEIGSLAQSFSNMRDAIRKKIDDLKIVNDQLQQAKDKQEQFNLRLEKKVEERTKKLAESEKRLAEAQKIAHLGNWEWNIVSDTLYFSDEAYRIFGVQPQEFGATYEAFLNFIHPDDRELVTDSVNTALNDKQPFRIDYRIVLNNHAERIVYAQGQVIEDQSGNPVRMIGTAQDITELKQTELELERAKQAAEAANHAKSQFLANMSHELRTPLNAILGFSQLMMRDKNVSREQLANLQTIDQSGNHLLSLINDVLEFSKIEAGQNVMNPKDFDLHRLLLGLEEMFRLRVRKRGLSLDFEKGDDVPQYIHADQSKLRQILINLLGNALKFTEEGRIILRVTNKEPERQQQTGECLLHFEVVDTGIGISNMEQKMIFNAFFQTNGQYSSQRGAGLGLPISQKFTELMGGVLKVKSDVGIGTCFSFDIPATIADDATIEDFQHMQKVIGLAVGQPAFRLLVVEDNDTNRNLLVKLLETVGFDVREAVNGQDAVEIWRKWLPHLVWMDMRLPVMDGYEATTIIKSEIQQSGSAIDTKIVALTASAFEEDRLKVIEHGGDDFVRKPFREHEIFKVIKKHLGVRYVYEKEDNRLKPAISKKKLPKKRLTTLVNDLPDEVIMRLKEATELSDADMIDEVIKEIRIKNAPLAEMLSNLTKQFAYDQILALTGDPGSRFEK